jgi:ribosomal protein S18 acetylase RimI-like enzyme
MVDMSVVIRRMKVEDIEDVKRVDMVTWKLLIENSYKDIIRITPRTDQNILSFLRADPDGAFVASDDVGGIIGSAFSHVWGKTGWTGPVSVLPSYQGRGIGKELVKSSLRYLEDENCADVGLETMPENTINVGMYLRAGLKPEGLVLIMGKRLDERNPPEEATGKISVERFSESEVKDHILGQIRHISDSLRPGLDYSREVKLTEEFSFGDTLFATAGGKVAGFCVMHTVPRRTDMRACAIRVLAVQPGLKEDIVEALLASSELIALDVGLPEISVPVLCQTRRAVDLLFSREYSVVQTFERMMWMGSSGSGEKSYNLVTWSG